MSIVLIPILVATFFLSGCSHPQFDQANFTNSTNLTNPYFSFEPGKKYVYEGLTEEGLEQITVQRLSDSKQVMGINVVVVSDRVTKDSKLVEDTKDWFAQDNEGNVWYMGEAVDNYDSGSGELRDHSGSWEAGVDGAKPGIAMLIKPAIGQSYRQEYYRGEAQDQAEVVELGLKVETPAGVFENVIKTRDWTELEPDVVEFKFYAPGVGLIKEVNENDKKEIVLVEITQ